MTLICLLLRHINIRSASFRWWKTLRHLSYTFWRHLWYVRRPPSYLIASPEVDMSRSWENHGESIIHHVPGDSKWPFHPLVGGHLTIEKGHLTIPKRAQRIAMLLKVSKWNASSNMSPCQQPSCLPKLERKTKKIASMRWKLTYDSILKCRAMPLEDLSQKGFTGDFYTIYIFYLKRCHRATVKDKVGKLTMIWLLTPRPLYIYRMLSSHIVESFPTMFAKGDDGRTSSCHRLQPISCLPHWWLLPLQRL